MDEEAVEPQIEEAPIDQIMESHEESQEVAEENDNEESKSQEKTMIPLSVAQKLRQQKRELELELQWERQRNAQQAAPKPVEDDESRYESATKADLMQSQEQAIRAIEEKLWIKQNPEKAERVDEYLPKFLKQRPNLASAISQASNRYEEAWELIDALTQKEQRQMEKQKAPPKKVAPNSPGGVPKAAVLNEAVDVMGMSDSEFRAWKDSKRRRR